MIRLPARGEQGAHPGGGSVTPLPAVGLATAVASPDGSATSVDLLARVAVTLTSTLELREVLVRLGMIAQQAVGAARCSLFLVEGDKLAPAVALGFRDEDLWAAFRDMDAIDIAKYQKVWSQLADGHAVVVDDAAADRRDVVPSAWAEQFDLRAVVVVGLLADGVPCGVLAVDHPTPGFFSADDARLLEALGIYAGMAVANARLYGREQRQAALQAALARGAAALSAVSAPAAVGQTLVTAYANMLGATLCATGLLSQDHTRFTSLAVLGNDAPGCSVPVSAVPDHILAKLTEAWTEDPHRPVAFGAERWFGEFLGAAAADHHVVLPLVVGRRPRGAALLGFPRRVRLDADERAAAGVLADLAAAVLERCFVHDQLARHARHMEVLHALSYTVAGGGDATAMVERLNGVLAGQGITVKSVAFRDRMLTRALGAESPARRERGGWKGEPEWVTLDGGVVSVPMRLGRRVAGGLRVDAGDLDDDDRAFVEAVAQGVAEAASRAALRGALEGAAREQALRVERDRIADDLHDTAGQIFVATGLYARSAMEQLPAESPWADRWAHVARLARTGKWEIDQAVRALAFVPAPGRDLPTALRALADSFERDSGIHTVVDVTGRSRKLPAPAVRALYRVAHEALSNAWRHSRCALVHVELSFDAEQTVLRVTDDGIGLGAARRQGPGIGVGSMRRKLEEVSGSLRLANSKPRGVLVEAAVPRRRR